VLVCTVAAIFLLDRDAVRLRAQKRRRSRFTTPQAQGPWRGQSGVTESVGAIMARQQGAAARHRPRVVFSIEHDRRRRLPGPTRRARGGALAGPESLRAHRRRIAARGADLTLPQTVGANFRGTRFGDAPQAESLSTRRLERRRRTSQFLVFVNDEVKVSTRPATRARWMSMTTSSSTACAAARRCLTRAPVYDRLSGRFFLTG